MKIMSEWRAFAALAVGWLGMPVDSMPLYSDANKWNRKAKKILYYILISGNFGHNEEQKHRSNNYFINKIQGVFFKMKFFTSRGVVFPLDSVKFFFHVIGNSIHLALEEWRRI